MGCGAIGRRSRRRSGEASHGSPHRDIPGKAWLGDRHDRTGARTAPPSRRRRERLRVGRDRERRPGHPQGRRAPRDDAHVSRPRAPLRAGLRRGARAGQPDAVHGGAGRRAGVAGARLALPAVPGGDDRRGQEDPARVRLLPDVGHPRRGGQQAARRRRVAGLRAAHGRPHRRRARRRPRPRRPGALARPRAVPRRPGVRRRDDRRDARVHRVPAQHRGPALDGAEGLGGVRPPLQARVVRPRQPLAALDAADGDDLRRPRHPRRLEHLRAVAPRDGGDRLVAHPHRRRSRCPTGCTSTSAT